MIAFAMEIGERTGCEPVLRGAKYNQLLCIEEELGAGAKFPGRAALAVYVDAQGQVRAAQLPSAEGKQGGSRAPALHGQRAKMFLRTKRTLAGRSARRRMYQAYQAEP